MTTIETKNGLTNARIVGPVKNEDYMKQDARRGDLAFVMSRSELKNFARCPSKWLAGFKEAQSDEMSYGDMLDCVVFTPEQFPDRFIVAPVTYPAKGKKKDDPEIQKPWSWNATFCKDWRDNQGEGVTVIKHDESESLLAAKSILFQDDQIAEILECSQFQVLIEGEYVDRETGIKVPLKGLVDIAPDASSVNYGKCLADLKTCKSAHPFNWAREINTYGYDMQAALYLDLWTAATGEDRCEFRHVLQENYPPFQIGKRLLSEEFINVGRSKYQTALKSYCQCLATKHWPNYETGNRVVDGWSITEPEAYML